MVNLFIELMQVSLCTHDMLSKVPSVGDWTAIYQEAQRQCVSSILLDGIERLPIEQRPSQQLLLQWICIVQMNEKNYSLQCERAKELTIRFKEKGYNSCVLKGVGLAQLYPIPSQRQGGDIDLWVDCERKELMKWLQSQCAMEHILWHHVEAKFFNDVPTEIHYHPCWLYNPFYNNRLQKWFEDQKSGQMHMDKNVRFAYPSVQFNAVYALVHLYHHLIEEGVGIRHIIDYYYILKTLSEKDRGTALNLLNRFGMKRLASSIMWILVYVCGLSKEYLLCESNEKEGRFLWDEIMRGGNFGHYRNDSRRRNSVGRMMALLPHYPKEVLWVVPWKLWHKCWRMKNARISRI